MTVSWRYYGLKTFIGNVLKDFFRKDAALQARVDAQLRRMRPLPLPWPITLFKNLGDGIGEIRVDFRKVEYRFYGFHGSQRFTVIKIGDDKKSEQKTIQAAKKLKKNLEQNGYEVEEYDV